MSRSFLFVLLMTAALSQPQNTHSVGNSSLYPTQYREVCLFGGMRIRSETDYAIRAICVLIEAEGRPLISKEIASIGKIPSSYILTIMCRLKNTGFVEIVNKSSTSNRGYRLLKDPQSITFYDVFRALEGDLDINFCLVHEEELNSSAAEKIKDEMRRINRAVIHEMSSKSIAEIMGLNHSPKTQQIDIFRGKQVT